MILGNAELEVAPEVFPAVKDSGAVQIQIAWAWPGRTRIEIQAKRQYASLLCVVGLRLLSTVVGPILPRLLHDSLVRRAQFNSANKRTFFRRTGKTRMYCPRNSATFPRSELRGEKVSLANLLWRERVLKSERAQDEDQAHQYHKEYHKPILQEESRALHVLFSASAKDAKTRIAPPTSRQLNCSGPGNVCTNRACAIKSGVSSHGVRRDVGGIVFCERWVLREEVFSLGPENTF